MPHSKMASFLDMITLFLATFSTIAGGIMCWLIYSNPSARVLIKRGNGGKHIRAIIFGILFSGLSSLPYLAFSLNFQSQICPFKWIHLFACLRVFSLRFEITQMLFLSIDRLIISLEMNTSRCRLLRRRLFRPFQCASFLIATVDLFMFIRRDQTWPSYSLDCILMFTSNSVFIHWHFFLMNFLALALTLALLLAQHIYQPDQLLNSSIRKRMSRLSNQWLIFFCIGLGAIFLLELANRFWPTFDANKLLRNYMDTIFQLLHLIYLPIFLRSVPWKSNGKIHTTASIQTIDLNLTRGGQTAGGGGNDQFS